MEHTKTANRIKELFERKKENILSVFFTAGFPALNDTATITESLQTAGADLIEIGIPFSDPIADGPVIQASSKKAIDNGMTLKRLLEQVGQIRQTVTLPIILMGYINPVLQFGTDRFFEDASVAGVDGLILPDMPFEEFQTLHREKMQHHGLCNIFLISPTTSEERIRKIDSASDGFIYAVSSSGTTGMREAFGADQISYFKRLKEMNLRNPFLIGFGVSNRETFATACKYGAGAIVGSAFIKLLGRSSDIPGDIKQFVLNLT